MAKLENQLTFLKTIKFKVMKAISYQLVTFNGFIYTFIQYQWDLSLSRMSYDYNRTNTSKNQNAISNLRGNGFEAYKIKIHGKVPLMWWLDKTAKGNLKKWKMSKNK